MNENNGSTHFTPAVGTAFYYIAAFLITYFIYIIEKPHYAHGINGYQFVGILFFLGGILWTVKTIGKLLIEGRTYLSTVIVNLVVIAVIIISFNYF